MRSPLALVEVPYHHPRTGENQRVWVVVKTEAAACGLRGYRVVFLREPTPPERVSVEATLSHSSEPEPRIFNLNDMLKIMVSKSLRPLSKILRGES